MSPKRPATRNPRKPAAKDRKPDRQPAVPVTAKKQPRNGPRVDPNDPVEEASWESFPASDPPSFNPAPKSRPGDDDKRS